MRRLRRRSAATAILSLLPALADAQPPMVRIAELEIRAADLDRYKAALTEEIETSIAVEAGVLAIQCVALKDKPTHLRFFEVYADQDAYARHLESPHFKKYVQVTKPMIKSRRLFETVPVILGSKDERGEGGPYNGRRTR